MAFKVAQISDIHCGDGRFKPKMLDHFIEEINEYQPDLVVIAGDLTAQGYEEQFVEAKKYLKKIACRNKIIIPGNHDYKNVGYDHFKKYFGKTRSSIVIPKNRIKGFGQSIRILAVNSSKPDMGEGEVGRYQYKHINKFFKGTEKDFTIFILHHHLISIPHTGLERNDVHDAGDVLKMVTGYKVNMVLSGHKHVPHVWELDGVKLISSGTGGTERTRGNIGSSINFITVDKSNVNLEIYFDKDKKITRKLKRTI